MRAAAGPAAAARAGWLRAVEAAATLLRWSLIAAVLVMLACIVIQVVMRYVFSNTPSWTEEVAVLMFAWATLGGLALGVREGFHVRLTALLDPLPPLARRLADGAIDLLTAALGLYLLWAGWRFVDITQGSVSAAVGYPIEWLHGLAPVSGALVLLFGAERVLAGPPATSADETPAP
ncbi:MAG: TRAP transporter small permease [Alphaproteobacteria bacterium]